MAACRASASLCSPPSSSGTCIGNPVQVQQALWTKAPNLNSVLIRNKCKLLEKKGFWQKKRLHVSAEYSDRKGGAGDFVTGFVLGGVVGGALGYLFAPQVNKVISAIERELDEPSKRLPMGLDDDEGLEKTRRNLNEKIAQLNAAIDDVSAQLRSDDQSGIQAGKTTELESAA